MAGTYLSKVKDLCMYLLWSWAPVAAVLFMGEAALNGIIIWRVRYTEIDWSTYMQQVSMVFNEGMFNYSAIHGDKGPLVYPAAHVWVMGALRAATNEGSDILRAQILFAMIYCLNFVLVLGIYAKAAPKGFAPFALVLLSISKRVHSIFVLRLFNDGIATTITHAAILLILHRRWISGSILYSFAVAVKMNVILYAPALAILWLNELGTRGFWKHVSLCAVVQLCLGAPFLYSAPISYIKGAFNLSRTFQHKWSVNFKWVPCEERPQQAQTLLEDCDGIFTSRAFALALLLLTVGVLMLLAHKQWLRLPHQGLPNVLIKVFGLQSRPSPCSIGPRAAARMLFTSNFVGVAFAKSLHFQFYVWYFFSLPLLIWSTSLPQLVRLVLLITMEACWNPWRGESSSTVSSALLTCCHLILVLALLIAPNTDSEDIASDNLGAGHEKPSAKED